MFSLIYVFQYSKLNLMLCVCQAYALPLSDTSSHNMMTFLQTPRGNQLVSIYQATNRLQSQHLSSVSQCTHQSAEIGTETVQLKDESLVYPDEEEQECFPLLGSFNSQKTFKGLGSRSVVQHSPNMHQTLGLILGTKNSKQTKNV